MSDDEPKFKITPRQIAMADTLMKVIHELSESPDDASAALLLVHVNLWMECGSGSTATMLKFYVEDFYAVTRSYQESDTDDRPLQ